jgi:hypothetical protein
MAALSTAATSLLAVAMSRLGFLPHTLSFLGVPAGALVGGFLCGAGLYVWLRAQRIIPRKEHHARAAVFALLGLLAIYAGTWWSARHQAGRRYAMVEEVLRSIEGSPEPLPEPPPAADEAALREYRRLRTEYQLSLIQYKNAMDRYNAYGLAERNLADETARALKADVDRFKERCREDEWRLRQFESALPKEAAPAARPVSDKELLAERQRQYAELKDVSLLGYLAQTVHTRSAGAVPAVPRIPAEGRVSSAGSGKDWLLFIFQFAAFLGGSVVGGLLFFGWRWGRVLAKCPDCGRMLRVPKREKAVNVRCPDCRAVFEVKPA